MVAQTGSQAFHYTFDEGDTLLHLLFSNSVSDKIIKILRSKLMGILIGLTVVIYQVWVINSKIQNLIEFVFYNVFISTSVIIWITFSIFWILSSNKAAFIVITTSFEFWLKLGAAILYQFCVLAFTVSFGNELRIIEISFIAVAFVLGIICVSLFDSVNLNRFGKIVTSLSFSLACTYYYVILQYIQCEKCKKKSEEIDLGFMNKYFDVWYRQVNTLRILTIFLWKQAILTLIRKDKAVLITCIPQIKWNQNQSLNNDNNIQRIKSISVDV